MLVHSNGSTPQNLEQLVVIDFVSIAKSVWQFCRESPGVVAAGVIGFCAFLYIIIDAHRHKKHRPRHRASK